MKRILAFGDSNTWGWDPTNGPIGKRRRFSDAVRWTGVAAQVLGDGYVIINEGLNGRTTVWDDPIEEYRCGKDQIIPLMDTHAPLDLVVIMLGTNDLKARFSVTAHDIAAGAKLVAEMALGRTGAFEGTPKVLLVCPPALGDVTKTRMVGAFEGGVEKSKRLHGYFEEAATGLGVDYLDAGALIHASAVDALHLDADQHQVLGQAIAAKIRAILG